MDRNLTATQPRLAARKVHVHALHYDLQPRLVRA
ncbi:hypothetical protein SAMN05428974_1149 [Sphingopyxis sp. YR583]|jgi:hypothetical protein|nr:hypothetical protein SAMN05428974_1149 [Sphingopyxis sp. YR583]